MTIRTRIFLNHATQGPRGRSCHFSTSQLLNYPQPLQLPPAINPCAVGPAMNHITDVDAKRLPGRDDEIAKIVRTFSRPKLGRAGLVWLHGPSGCGKTSLIQARICPTLQEGFGDGFQATRETPENGDDPAALIEAIAGESVTGFVTIKAGTKNGAVSGSAVINGVKETFKGTANANGSFATTTNRGRNVSFNVFQVTGGSGGFKLTGAFAGDNGGHQFQLVRSGFHKTTNPNNAFDGLFTMVLPSAQVRGVDAPNGDGYGTASIGIDGKSRTALVLGDGTKTTHSGFVSVDGEWLIHRDLYRTKPKGFIAGRLLFRDEVGISDFDGELQWVKRADAKEKRFNRGFEIRQIALGSEYTPPAVGQRAFVVINEFGGAIQVGLTDGDVVNLPETHLADWGTTNKVTYVRQNKESLAVKVNSKNGLVTGSYTDKSRKQKVSFGGVIFEKQQLLTGHFLGVKDTGVFSIRSAAR